MIVVVESRVHALQQPGTGTAAARKQEPKLQPVTGTRAARDDAKELAPRRKDVAIPILMYHVIGDPPPAVGDSDLYVSAADFERHLEWLQAHGYEAVTLSEVWNHWQGVDQLPRHPIVFTFDDGTRSVYARAFPALASRSWPAVLNLDASNLEPAWGIRRSQVRALIAAGWELASHTLTHPDLTALDDAGLRREVRGSRRELRLAFDVPVDFFCYPSGRFNDRVIAAVKSAGYLGATTTIPGLARPADPYLLARVRVNRSDGASGLTQTLRSLEASG